MKVKNTLLLTLLIGIISLGLASTGFASEDPPPSPKPVAYPWVVRPDLFELPVAEEDSLLEPRIVGGTSYTPQNKYPWIASLQYDGHHYCGGTLIDPDWILTSAHCWTDEFGNVFVPNVLDDVVLGAYDFLNPNGNEQVFGVAEVHIHPGYDYFTFENDLALLKLDSSATINDYVQTIPMVGASPGNLNYTPATITGWGDYYYQQPSNYNNVVREAQIEILPNTSCSNYGSFFNPESMLCGGLPDYSKDACQGDSGGALFYDDGGQMRVAGVTSWGNGCAKDGFPGVYARVSSAYAWINAVAGLADIPVLLSPEHLGEYPETAFVFDWTDVPGYTRYHFLFSRYSNFTAPRLYIIDDASEFDPGFNFPAGPIFWKVRVVDIDGDTYTFGEWSMTYVLVAGDNGYPIATNMLPIHNDKTEDRTPSFSWSYNGNVPQYQFQLSHYSTFDTPMSLYPTQKSFTAPTLPTGVWFWRVRGMYSLTTYGPWSEWRRLTISPAGGMGSAAMEYPGASTVREDDINPTFDWSDVNGATSYTLQDSRYSNFHTAETYNVGVSEYPYTSNTEGGTIFWRVRGQNSTTTGPWSEWRKHVMKVNGLPSPQPLTPNNPETRKAGDITFMWGPVNGAISGYELSITKEGIGETINFTSDTQMTLNLTVGTYHWKARAVGGPWGEIRVLYINP